MVFNFRLCDRCIRKVRIVAVAGVLCMDKHRIFIRAGCQLCNGICIGENQRGSRSQIDITEVQLRLCIIPSVTDRVVSNLCRNIGCIRKIEIIYGNILQHGVFGVLHCDRIGHISGCSSRNRLLIHRLCYFRMTGRILLECDDHPVITSSAGMAEILLLQIDCDSGRIVSIVENESVAISNGLTAIAVLLFKRAADNNACDNISCRSSNNNVLTYRAVLRKQIPAAHRLLVAAGTCACILIELVIRVAAICNIQLITIDSTVIISIILVDKKLKCSVAAIISFPIASRPFISKRRSRQQADQHDQCQQHA